MKRLTVLKWKTLFRSSALLSHTARAALAASTAAWYGPVRSLPRACLGSSRLAAFVSYPRPFPVVADQLVKNVFARIVRKEEPADIVYEDDTVMAFKDAHPVAPCHLLIVPKSGAVRDPSHLNVQHVDLLEHMVAVGKQLLKERAGLTPNQQTAQASLGFHMAPFTLVPHLHMHAIAPLRSLNIWQRVHFLVGSFWYQSAEKILGRLKSQQTTQLTL